MQRFKLQLIVLLSAFFIGLTAYFFFNLLLASIQETTSQPKTSNVDSALNIVRQEYEQKPTDFYDISPCIEENVYKKYSRKAVATRSFGVVNWRIACGVMPEYPQIRNNVQDIVTVSVLIDEDGEVIESRIISGNRFFHKSALTASRQTRFIPALLGGELIKVRGVLIYEFDSQHGVKLKK